MPTASERQRELMRKWFGSIDLHGPSDFLLSRGYKIDNGWIIKPTPAHTWSQEELECADFLCNEWDYAA